MTSLKSKDKDGNPYGDNLSLDTESGHYVWRERVHGVNHWKSTGTDKISLARLRVKSFRSEATGEPTERIRHSFNEAFDLTLAIKRGRGVKTEKSAIDQIEGNLRPWFKINCPYLSTFERDSEELWARYQTDQAERTPGRKLRHDREILLFALKRAREKGWLTKEFGTKTKHGKFGLELNEATDPIGRFVEDEEANQILSASRRNPTLYLQVRMALLMGMRNGEILKARWSEFDWKSGEIVIGGSRVKTRRGRRVPIHQSLITELRERQKASGGDFVFPARFTRLGGAPIDWKEPQTSNHKAYERARTRAKSDARFHDLRHTFMTNAMAEGLQPADVSKITGASLKVVMAIYHHVRGDVREKAKALFCGKFVGVT